jgi:hypothetical protein
MDMTDKVLAYQAVTRIESSVFATPEECAEARHLADLLTSSDGQHRASFRAELRGLLRTVLDRESGLTVLSVEEREAINESLDDLQNRLIEEIELRKKLQRRDMIFIRLLLVLLIGLTASSALVILFQRDASTQGAVTHLTATAFLLSVSILTARLFQNSREALERLDEKVVAVRFFRMALHPHWTVETGAELMASAVGMFVHHFAPVSNTLSSEDTSHFFPVLPGLSVKQRDKS